MLGATKVLRLGTWGAKKRHWRPLIERWPSIQNTQDLLRQRFFASGSRTPGRGVNSSLSSAGHRSELCRRWYAVEVTLKALGRPEEGSASFDKARVNAPRVCYPRRLKDAASQDLGAWGRGIGSVPTGTKDPSEGCPAQCHKGRTLLTLGRLEEAIAAFDRALGIDPDDAGACTTGALCFKTWGGRGSHGCI